MVYIDEHIMDFDLDAALQQISEQRREQALRFKFERGQRTCVLAYLLLRKALPDLNTPPTPVLITLNLLVLFVSGGNMENKASATAAKPLPVPSVPTPSASTLSRSADTMTA